MKKVVYVTKEPFWLPGAGVWARSLALVRFLSRHVRLAVFYLGPERAINQQMQKSVVSLPLDRLGPRGVLERMHGLCTREKFDACILDRIEMQFTLAALPPTVKRFLDTIDVVHERNETFARDGYDLGKVTREDEFAIFRKFDAVIAIQEREQKTIAEGIDPERVVLALHPPTLRKRALRDPVRIIGTVASPWLPNVTGLKWFRSEVWPLVQRPGVSCHIHGSVCVPLKGAEVPGIALKGPAPELEAVYDSLDIAINTVPYGAGLKIKTVEALGAGLPLVTTSEGARGLERAAGSAFLVADAPPDFAAALQRLIDDRAERQRLSDAAYAFAEQTFSPDACFSDLLREIEAPRRLAQ